MVEKNLPTNPSKVFTCYGYAYDELFKIYLSNIKQKKYQFILVNTEIIILHLLTLIILLNLIVVINLYLGE